MVAPTHAPTRVLRRRDDDGASAVEFALISMFLFTLLFGMMQYGFYFWQRQGASAAAQEAARASSVGKWECSDTDGDPSNDLKLRVGDAIPRGQTGLVVTRSYSGGLTADAEVGDEVVIDVSFPAFSLGVVPLPDGGNVQASATARLENVTSSSGACA